MILYFSSYEYCWAIHEGKLSAICTRHFLLFDDVPVTSPLLALYKFRLSITLTTRHSQRCFTFCHSFSLRSINLMFFSNCFTSRPVWEIMEKFIFFSIAAGLSVSLIILYYHIVNLFFSYFCSTGICIIKMKWKPTETPSCSICKTPIIAFFSHLYCMLICLAMFCREDLLFPHALGFLLGKFPI